MTAIKPDYYHKNNLDWFEAFEKLASLEFDPFEAAMVENIGKYILRFPEKNGLEDLEKAQYTLERLIKHVKGPQSVLVYAKGVPLNVSGGFKNVHSSKIGFR